MAIFVKFVTALFFLSLISKGNCQCFLNNLSIEQTTTGFQIHGMTEWKVTISNKCHCSQSEVKLDCTGFQTTESVDPSILAISGTECLVNNGQPIFNSNPITFTYANNSKFNFTPISSQIACS